MRKRWCILGFIALLIAALAALLLSGPREPKYNGRSLSQWLDDLGNAPVEADAAREEAISAVRQIGSNAVPFLVRMLEAKDSSLKKFLIDLEAEQSVVNISFKRAEMRRSKATLGFEALGELAAPAIPALTNLFDDTEIAVPALYSVACTGRDGIGPLTNLLLHSNDMIRSHTAIHLSLAAASNAELAVPALLRSLRDPSDDVRRMCIRSLGLLKASPEIVVPSLSVLLRDPNSRIRQETALALGKFHSNALPVVPELKQIMTDEKTFQAATTALLAIDRSKAMASLEGILRDTNSPLRARAAARLGRLGVEGKAAIPTLLDLLTDGDDSLRRTVTNALLEIDGSVATNAGIRPVPPRPRGPRRGIPSP